MQIKPLHSKKKFSVLGEITDFRSKEYSNFKKKFYWKNKNQFFSENGNFINTCHIFRNILHLDLIDARFERTVLYGINNKQSICSKLLKLYNSFEFWLSSKENFKKRVSFIFLKGDGDIWQFKLVKKKIKNKSSIELVLLFGTSIWILNIPYFLPQFLFIKNPLTKIKLANLFQWKMHVAKNIILTGDIYGRVTIIKNTKNLKISQIIHNKQENNPIGDLKLIEFGDKRPNLLITGGFDGTLKIWSILKKIILLKEIRFNKRWLIQIDFKLFKEESIFIFVNFENGFIGIISFYDKFKIFKKYFNQGNSKIVSIYSNYTISVGNDGYVNFIEINSPISKPLNVLNLFDNPSFFFRWGIKPKLNNTIAQSVGTRYQNNNIKLHLNESNEIEFSVSGFHGVIIFFDLKSD